MSSLRILHLDSGATLRGGQWQLLHLIDRLHRLGHHCRLLARANSLLFAEAELKGIPVAPLTPLNLRRESAQSRIVHCHDAHSHTLAALLSRAPVVVSRRVGFPVGSGPLSRWKYSRPLLFLAVSEYVREQLLHARVPASRIRIVPDAVPLPALTSTLDGPAIAVESGDPAKGNALIRQTGLPIRFTRDILSDLRSARALVYVSEMEGLGSAALLAMAWGVPVVASNVGGLPEIVSHEGTGLLVHNQPAEIAAAVTRLLEDLPLARTLGRNGRALVEDRFTVDRMADLTLDAYRQVIG